MRKIIVIIISIIIYSCEIKEPSPNFIIFIADDVSWDDLGCYGNIDVKTPNIDNLAKNGIIFKNTYLTTSSCSPSRNSILTGRYPHNTGAAELHTEPPLEMISIPEILKTKGYYSLLAGKFHMGEYARKGFDEIHDNRKINGDGGEKYWTKAIKKRPKNKPFFMWFSSYDAHRVWGENQFSGTHDPNKIKVPKYLVDNELTRIDLSKYYDEISRFDFYIGKVVKELKKQNVLENTMIIVMADNGRPFPHSKTRLNDQGVKTPFIINYPKLNKGNKTSNSLISSIDIAPTIIELAKINKIDNFQGESFLDIIKKPENPFRNYIFSEHNWHDYESHQRMVRNKNYLYIRNSRPSFPQEGPLDAINSMTYLDLKNGKKDNTLTDLQAEIFLKPRSSEEFYDLNKDPFQFDNLIISDKGIYKSEKYNELKIILDVWIKETGDNLPINLTKDWYQREQEPNNESSLLKTEYHGIRGEMPGKLTNAISNNNKGPF
jgi:arylsulfatase A-like enzyme